MAVVLMVDAVCGAQHNGAAAILAAHGGRVSFHLRQDIEKGRKTA